MFSGRSGKQRGHARNSQQRVSHHARSMLCFIGIRVSVDHTLLGVVLLSLWHCSSRPLGPFGSTQQSESVFLPFTEAREKVLGADRDRSYLSRSELDE